MVAPGYGHPLPDHRPQHLLLLPPDLRDWVPDDDLVHFVIDAVAALPLAHLKLNRRGTGDAQYPPALMLRLLIYCYVSGFFSSRRIKRATWQNVRPNT